jgi:hypothetical protein
MKIVFFPGVGFHKNPKRFPRFLDRLNEQIKFDYEVHNWLHDYLNDDHGHNHFPNDKNLHSRLVRGWVSEVILDFQHVLLHADKMELPEADVYMGHSAGSVIALARAKKKKCIMFGSPLHLLSNKDFPKEHFLHNCQCPKTEVLNIVHKNDVLSYPVDKSNVENFYINSGILSFSRYCFLTAHGSYWTNKACINKVVDQLKKWS